MLVLNLLLLIANCRIVYLLTRLHIAGSHGTVFLGTLAWVALSIAFHSR